MVEYYFPKRTGKLVRVELLPYHLRGFDADGYGSKIKVGWQLICASGKPLQVYTYCYSNCASHYVIVNR